MFDGCSPWGLALAVLLGIPLVALAWVFVAGIVYVLWRMVREG